MGRQRPPGSPSGLEEGGSPRGQSGDLFRPELGTQVGAQQRVGAVHLTGTRQKGAAGRQGVEQHSCLPLLEHALEQVGGEFFEDAAACQQGPQRRVERPQHLLGQIREKGAHLGLAAVQIVQGGQPDPALHRRLHQKAHRNRPAFGQRVGAPDLGGRQAQPLRGGQGRDFLRREGQFGHRQPCHRFQTGQLRQGQRQTRQQHQPGTLARTTEQAAEQFGPLRVAQVVRFIQYQGGPGVVEQVAHPRRDQPGSGSGVQQRCKVPAADQRLYRQRQPGGQHLRVGVVGVQSQPAERPREGGQGRGLAISGRSHHHAHPGRGEQYGQPWPGECAAHMGLTGPAQRGQVAPGGERSHVPMLEHLGQTD